MTDASCLKKYFTNPKNPLVPAAICFGVAFISFIVFNVLHFFESNDHRHGFMDLGGHLHFFTMEVENFSGAYWGILTFVVFNTLLRSYGSEFAWQYITLQVKQGQIGDIASPTQVYIFLVLWYSYVGISGLFSLYIALSRFDMWVTSELVEMAVALVMTKTIFLKDFKGATASNNGDISPEKNPEITLQDLQKRLLLLEKQMNANSRGGTTFNASVLRNRHIFKGRLHY